MTVQTCVFVGMSSVIALVGAFALMLAAVGLI